MGQAQKRFATIALLGLSFSVSALAHEHHEVDTGPFEHNFTNEEPIDSVLKWHIAIQTVSWGILFPVGMILGLNKSRFHVPFQLVTIALSLVGGNYLGHHHGGRSFHMTAHAAFAAWMWWYVVVQAAIGAFLKLHVLEPSRVRTVAKGVHRWVGISFPVVGWIQMVFGAIASLGFCFGEHFGQCLAHEIMGGSFILYACFMLIMLKLGAGFLERRRTSQEFFDSTIIMLWGIVNAASEHNAFGQNSAWSHKDMQHVSLGVLWVCGGLLGMWLSRDGKRSVVPAMIIAMTGLAMANHGQHLEFSTTVHKAFGYSLVAAGLARLIEICFILHDEPTPSLSSDPSSPVASKRVPRAFQHLPPYLLVLSGLTFMAATEEQMAWVAGSGMDSTTYVNGLFSGAFVVYLVAVALVDLFVATRAPGAPRRRTHDVEATADDDGSTRRAPPSSSWWRDVVARTTGWSDRGRGAATEGSRRDGEYESVPLTTDHVVAGSSEESFELERRRTDGPTRHTRDETAETVFELGDEEEEDRGDDGYWKEDDHRAPSRLRT
ncbi:hypothetical protein JCM11491_006624 [Sporobolomyces phaffii]